MTQFKITNKVVQSNNLIRSMSKMDTIPFKIFEMAVSCIDTKNPEQEVELNKFDIFNFFETESTAKYTLFKTYMVKLNQSGINVLLPNEEEELINVTSGIRWGKRTDKVTIRFNDLIMPYLIEMKKNFTQYEISEIKNIRLKNSLILYKWLVMNFGEKPHKKKYTIKVSELRKITDTERVYERFGNFERKVLEETTQEINANTSLKVTYEKIKTGRSISDIIFTVCKKKPSDYLEELGGKEKEFNGQKKDFESLFRIISLEWNEAFSSSEKVQLKFLYDKFGYDSCINSLRSLLIKQVQSIRYLEKSLENTM